MEAQKTIFSEFPMFKLFVRSKGTSALKIETVTKCIFLTGMGELTITFYHVNMCDIQELTDLLNLLMISLSANDDDDDDVEEDNGKWIICAGTFRSIIFKITILQLYTVRERLCCYDNGLKII
jgi:hypothetical protein